MSIINYQEEKSKYRTMVHAHKQRNITGVTEYLDDFILSIFCWTLI